MCELQQEIAHRSMGEEEGVQQSSSHRREPDYSTHSGLVPSPKLILMGILLFLGTCPCASAGAEVSSRSLLPDLRSSGMKETSVRADRVVLRSNSVNITELDPSQHNASCAEDVIDPNGVQRGNRSHTGRRIKIGIVRSNSYSSIHRDKTLPVPAMDTGNQGGTAAHEPGSLMVNSSNQGKSAHKVNSSPSLLAAGKLVMPRSMGFLLACFGVGLPLDSTAKSVSTGTFQSLASTMGEMLFVVCRVLGIPLFGPLPHHVNVSAVPGLDSLSMEGGNESEHTNPASRTIESESVALRLDLEAVQDQLLAMKNKVSKMEHAKSVELEKEKSRANAAEQEVQRITNEFCLAEASLVAAKRETKEVRQQAENVARMEYEAKYLNYMERATKAEKALAEEKVLTTQYLAKAMELDQMITEQNEQKEDYDDLACNWENEIERLKSTLRAQSHLQRELDLTRRKLQKQLQENAWMRTHASKLTVSREVEVPRKAKSRFAYIDHVAQICNGTSSMQGLVEAWEKDVTVREERERSLLAQLQVLKQREQEYEEIHTNLEDLNGKVKAGSFDLASLNVQLQAVVSNLRLSSMEGRIQNNLQGTRPVRSRSEPRAH